MFGGLQINFEFYTQIMTDIKECIRPHKSITFTFGGNGNEYAGPKAVELAYREAMEQLTDSCLSNEAIYARGDRNIQFTIYQNQNGCRDIYFIATDWHIKNPDSVGTLVLNGNEYSIPVTLKYPVKVTAYGDCVLYPENSENEVISIDASTARVQGIGIAKFILCKDGICTDIFVDFSTQSVQNIDILDKNII